MNILMTGATGFVGNALFSELLFRKQRVTCVFRETFDEKHQQMKFNDCHRLVVKNIDGNTRWTSYLTNISQVVHLAGLAHVPGKTGRKEYQSFFSVNHEGTRNLAVQAARQGVRRFLFMSSVLVNGSANMERPFCETDRAIPQNAYAASKYEAEKSLEQIGAETGMEVVILRPPLVYGPGVKGNFLKLMNLVYAGIPMPLGKISNRRSFIGLKNLVDALCLCIEHEKAGNQTFMVSDGEDLSTSQLITTIAAAMERPCRLFAVPEKFVENGLSLLGRKDVYDRLWGTLQVDSSKIRSRLGWHPPVPMDREIAETAHWYLNNRRRHTRLNA